MSKPQARLEEWVKVGVTNPFFFGRAFGHPLFPDGRFIRTGEAIRLDGNTVETDNTIYALGKPFPLEHQE